ncbi:hypothetical protein D9611_009867 [Ephemerocybe angulata]|uniref:Uncharacterized protein n=1 Tax=Ephemerocybe angulata TaxID=980116 RepID=A0A8H5CEP5_9AGAR|nr:hypothetical protein D9611_009867 [Tulosesus angulatus]
MPGGDIDVVGVNTIVDLDSGIAEEEEDVGVEEGSQMEEEEDEGVLWLCTKLRLCRTSHAPFDYRPLEVEKIEYDLKESKRLNEKPHVLVNMYLENDADTEQMLTYKLNEKTVATSRWDYKVGFKVGYQAKFKGGIPKIAEGEVSTDYALTFKFSQVKTTTTEQAWKASFPVKARGRERIRARVHREM